jgi:hypothetical protein
MPIFDLQCSNCGTVIRDRYYHTYEDSEKPVWCSCNRGFMKKLVPLVIIHDFIPYRTRNMRKDGKEVYVSCRARERELMRENGVVRHPFADSIESKADPRELLQAVKEERRDFPKRYQKLQEKVKRVPDAEAQKIAARADEHSRKVSGMTSHLRGGA